MFHGSSTRHAIALLVAAATSSVALACSETQVAAPPPAAPPPADTVAPPPPPPHDPVVIMLGGGCEEAKTAYVKECSDPTRGCPDGKASQLAGTVSYGQVLNDGAYLETCKSPASATVKICAAIRNGHAVAVTVTNAPGDGPIANCIGRAVQGLTFPSSPRLDVASTVFAAQ